MDGLEERSQPDSSELTTREPNVEPSVFSHFIEQSSDNLAEILRLPVSQIVSGTSQITRLSDYHRRYLLQMLKFMMQLDEVEQSARDRSLSPNQLKVLDQAKGVIAHFTQCVNEIEKHR